MSATVANAIKTHLETLSLGVPIFRDAPGQEQAPPYIVVLEGIGMTPEPQVNSDNDNAVRELVQIDIFQLKRDKNRTITESYTLPNSVANGVNGARLPTSPTKAWRLQFLNMVRIPPDQETQVLQHSITGQVRRQLT